jgi:class 3 adenylate cyclase/tetratricopeptide (TPR) repeat protein
MKCPRCRHDNAPGGKFCVECGAQLTPVAPSDRFSAPERYTPTHLAEKILTSKAALEGERKQVTVLFADMKGSMEFVADRDPEEARNLLDPVLERMMEAVHHYEGTVNQVMGDGIMALFGAPLAHEDHAVRACYAALRMQDQVKRYAEEVRRAHGVNVQIRVGLNSGEVVVRAIGSDLHMDYTAVGQTTHLANRMEQFASPGSVLLTPSTLALLEGFVSVTPLGPVPVKGLAGAVEVYEVTGAGPARTRLQATARRGLTRFVGRDAELRELHRAQQLAAEGQGQVVAVVGEAGVGKSRLVYELTHSHRLQGWRVLESASVAYGTATSYLPVIDLLRSYFRIEDRDDLREIREKVAGKLLTLDEALKPALPAILALLDVPVEDAAWPTLAPDERRRRTHEAVKHLLLREARVQPLLVIVEDLHWVDGETQAVLDGLVESLGAARLMLLVNYRPAYRHAWGGKPGYRQVRLETLPADRTGELLEALLGADPALGPLKQLLVKRGNPFFLEETVQTLVETKVLAGERSRYRLTRPVQSIQVPRTVQVMLAARIDRLAPEDKRLLQTASAVGKDVPFALLRAIADLPEEALRRGLARVQGAEFLYETRLDPDPEYTFKHALTHEVAYGSLLQERRRDLHGRILDAIETLHRARLGEQIERLAHHAFCAESWERALGYLRQAGARAFARASHLEAAGYFERALAALKRLPESRERIEQAIDILFDLQLSLLPLGKLERGLDFLREAEALVGPLDDARRSGQLAIYLTGQRYLMGDLARALETGERALSIAGRLNDLRLTVSANAYLGQVYHARGEYRRAAELFRRNVRTLVGALVTERFGLPQLPSVHSRTCLVWSLAELGEFAEGIACGEEGIRIAESVDQPFSLTVAYAGLGMLYLRRGDLPRAIPPLERGVARSRSGNAPLWFPRIASDLGLAYALSGRLEEGVPLLEQAVEQATSMRLIVTHALLVAALAEGRLLAGRDKEATELARRALDLAREHAEPGHEARALRLLGDLALRRDPPDADGARACYLQALALAERLAMRPLLAQSHLGLGRAYRAAGQRGPAREHLIMAVDLFRGLGMPLGAGQAEAALADSG